MRADAVASRRASVLPAARLRVASDQRLVEETQVGSERAFEVLFDRYHGPVLAFCRHMLGSREEAEDAAQQTFMSAYRELVRGEHPRAFRPWLYGIARHRCLSALRGRCRRSADAVPERGADHLLTEVTTREDLRELLADVARLPFDQRAALVLAELGDVPHEEIAAILGCPRAKVKALVFQARSSLSAGRAARALTCTEVRDQLATLRGAALGRRLLRRHLRDCVGCRTFRDKLRNGSRRLGLLLPALPMVIRRTLAGAVTASGGGAGGAAVTAGAVSGVGVTAAVVVAVAISAGLPAEVLGPPHGDRQPSRPAAAAVTTAAPAISPPPRRRGALETPARTGADASSAAGHVTGRGTASTTGTGEIGRRASDPAGDRAHVPAASHAAPAEPQRSAQPSGTSNAAPPDDGARRARPPRPSPVDHGSAPPGPPPQANGRSVGRMAPPARGGPPRAAPPQANGAAPSAGPERRPDEMLPAVASDPAPGQGSAAEPPAAAAAPPLAPGRAEHVGEGHGRPSG